MDQEKRKRLAEAAADYMVEVGTSRTWSRNYHFSFEEIGAMIGVDLANDRDMIGLIVEAAYGKHTEMVCELLTDSDFDFMFYLAYCPNADDDPGM